MGCYHHNGAYARDKARMLFALEDVWYDRLTSLSRGVGMGCWCDLVTGLVEQFGALPRHQRFP